MSELNIKISDLNVTYISRVFSEDQRWYQQLFWPRYQHKTVLNKAYFEVSGSGITAILGRNGSGKTTLLKTISGILTPTNGTLRVMECIPHRRSKNLLMQLGVLFGQKKLLWNELSLRENLKITAAIYKVPKSDTQARSEEVIHLFDMEDLADRPLKTLSLGESMKAELANILFYRPKLIILDEPTIGLDLPAQHKIRKAIAEYVKLYNAHVLLTSHNLKDITQLADQIYFLESGKLAPIEIDESNRHVMEAMLEKKLVQ